MTEPQQANADWTNREQAVLDRLTEQFNVHRKWAARSFWAERSLAIIVLICAVLAPLTVASGSDTGGLAVFGLKDPQLKQLSLVLTITLALAEGLRRICKFDERYSISAQSREKIRFGREAYLESQIGLEPGTSEWRKNLQYARSLSQDISLGSVGAYIAALTAQREPPENPGK